MVTAVLFGPKSPTHFRDRLPSSNSLNSSSILKLEDVFSVSSTSKVKFPNSPVLICCTNIVYLLGTVIWKQKNKLNEKLDVNGRKTSGEKYDLV